jgi:hypothetical protein
MGSPPPQPKPDPKPKPKPEPDQTTGTTYGPVGMGSPPPEPEQPKQDDNALMSYQDAYQSMADAGIKSLSGDVTGDEKGLDAKIKQKQSGMLSNPYQNIAGPSQLSLTADDISDNLQITETKAKEKVTEKTTYSPTYLSYIRDFANKYMPAVFPQYAYSVLGGETQNVPLQMNNFNSNEQNYIKENALNSILENFQSLPVYSNGVLKPTKPIVVSYWAGNPLSNLIDFKGESRISLDERSVGAVLGDATAYINQDGELIVTDYYDWETGVNLYNPDTLKPPETLPELSYTVAKTAALYFTDKDAYKKGSDYERPEDLSLIPKTEDEQKSRNTDTYFISKILLDSAETIANIIGPKKYEQKSIFDVPEEKRMVLNFGKVIATNQGLKLQSEITPSPSTNLQTQNPPGVN